MFDFCQPVFDVVGEADAVEGNDSVFCRAFALSKLNAIISQERVELVRHGLEQAFKARFCQQARGPFMQLGMGELRCAVNDDEQIQLALFGLHFGNIDVTVTDRVCFELLFFAAARFCSVAGAICRAVAGSGAGSSGSGSGWRAARHTGSHPEAKAYSAKTSPWRPLLPESALLKQAASGSSAQRGQNPARAISPQSSR